MRTPIESFTRGMASQTIKNIEAISYLTRIRSENDGRKVQFVLTEKTWNDLPRTCGRKINCILL
ncbi:hypothetical protein ABA45_09150 [Marinobacter psychrophilus]|uniref:HTH marR-type domain-containing protein n=1 Tax=Marinobacter psychrophilus TaxID=330734 RepID=A0A0H4I0R5_9GAMM|nr:hypothetical protein ABA45_09150 [Marinobacter psychrophilus]